MIFSYTQISEYLACPRRYRYRYLEGFQEKKLRASMVFGRAFEKALAAYFLQDDGMAVFSEQWAEAQQLQLEYTEGDTWQSMLAQGCELLNQFAQDGRVSIPHPKQDLQLRVMRRLESEHDFVGYTPLARICSSLPESRLLSAGRQGECAPPVTEGIRHVFENG